MEDNIKKSTVDGVEQKQYKPTNKYRKTSNFKFQKRKKFCKFCAQGIESIDYKDVETLTKYINYNCKISPKKINGNCTKHQRRISNAIKRSRIVALMPFVAE